ncbi:hypothetical protein DFJ43DRAFT_1094072, partial [Lentinula guzmanii]
MERESVPRVLPVLPVLLLPYHLLPRYLTAETMKQKRMMKLGIVWMVRVEQTWRGRVGFLVLNPPNLRLRTRRRRRRNVGPHTTILDGTLTSTIHPYLFKALWVPALPHSINRTKYLPIPVFRIRRQLILCSV